LATLNDLRGTLARVDGRGYKAYKQIKGVYDATFFSLIVDHVQGDPYAAPSRLRAKIPGRVAAYPEWTFAGPSARIGLCAYLSEQFATAVRRTSSRKGSGGSGLLCVEAPGQEILESTSVLVSADEVEARFVAGLPAAGRRVLGRQAAQMLCDDVPQAVRAALRYSSNDPEQLRSWVETNEDADALRAALQDRGLVAFVADGSVLPRRSGVDPRPLGGRSVVRFRSPESLRQEIVLPHRGAVVGMGIPKGVTLIVGGGFHGKSTLLSALELGVYNHRVGDGRELVVTDAAAVKIRAEDGRRVEGVDISPFIGRLPQGRDTQCFRTDNASGSTSQAANIIEATELGARVLLMDEDTAATNFMIRDHRMQELVAKEREPITPFLDKVRQLNRDHGVSTVLVMGGSGDYFDVADTVIAMEDYVPRDVTEEARRIADRHKAERTPEGGEAFGECHHRIPLPSSLDPSRGRREESVKTRGRAAILFGDETVALDAVAQLVHAGQTRAVADAMLYARNRYMDDRRTLAHVIDLVMRDVHDRGLDAVSRAPRGDYAAFRRFELGAAINRLRTLKVRQERMG
jgi:predicted ABC-class ATPase